MKKILIIAVLSLVLWQVFKSPERMPSQVLPHYAAGQDMSRSLVGGRCPKDRCLLVVVAPWCPACRSMKGTIEALRDQLEADGVPVTVLVAMDQADDLKTLAAAYAKPVALDIDGQFHKRVGVDAVPYFAVTNAKAEIIEVMRGGMYDVAGMREELGL